MNLRTFRRVAVAVVSAGLLATGTAYVTQSASAADGFFDQAIADRGTPIVFRVDGQDRCVDIPSDRLHQQTELQVWDCTGGDNQKWVFEPTDPAVYDSPATLRSPFGTCVDLAAARPTRGMTVIQRPCEGGALPHWYRGNGCLYQDPDPRKGCDDWSQNVSRWYNFAANNIEDNPRVGVPMNMSVQITESGAANGSKLVMGFHPNPGEDVRGNHFAVDGPDLFVPPPA